MTAHTVLHLVHPPTAGDAAMARLRLLMDADPGVHHALIIGGCNDEAHARRRRLPPFDRVSPPLGRPEFAAPALRTFLRRRPLPDLIHAWSPPALALAWLARVERPVIATFALPPGDLRSTLHRRLLRRAANHAAALCFTNPWTADRWRGLLRHRGVERVIPNATLRPSPAARRDELRAEWNIDDDTLLILTGGDPAPRLPSRILIFVTALTVYSGQPAALVLGSGARDLERARRFDVNYGGPWRIIFDDRPREDLLAAADAALWHHPPTGPGALRPPVGIELIEHAAVQAVPIVAGEHPLLDELRATLPRRPHAARPILDLVQQILHVRSRPEEARAQADALRHGAAARHDPARWLNAHRRLYQNV